MKKPKECYGCKSNVPDNYYDTLKKLEPSLVCEIPPKFKADNHIYGCPCISCLVKSMCTTGCRSAKQYIYKYSDHVKHYTPSRKMSM